MRDAPGRQPHGSRSRTPNALSESLGRWGPGTWGRRSPAEEEAAYRAAMRASEPRPDGVLSWLGLHPWVWVLSVLGAAFVVLGPWLNVLIPSGSGTAGFLCSISPTGTVATFTAANGVILANLAQGQSVMVFLNGFGEVVGVGAGGGPVPPSTVTGIVDAVTQNTLTITEVEGRLSVCPQ